MPLYSAKICELHVHTGGCLTAEDMLSLGRDIYKEVDWSLFCNSYKEAFELNLDPKNLFEDVISRKAGSLEKFKKHYIFTEQDGGDFNRFQAKFNLIICLMRHLKKINNRYEAALFKIMDRHRREGLDFVEYRCSCAEEEEKNFHDFHYSHISTLQKASPDGLTAHYIIGLRRWAALEDYLMVQRLMDNYPDVISTLVGIDFSHFEEGFPPKTLGPFFKRVQNDNKLYPDRALEIVYHVGETYFDKSLESAVRWCHEASEMGAKRLGHAIALGLDPAIAILRKPNAHLEEPVSERLDQIAYDLSCKAQIELYGIQINEKALESEREILEKMDPQEPVQKPYDEQRLEEIRNRQKFVLNRLAEIGTVIEICPTSNLRIGGIPDSLYHPIHRFLDSKVNLAICTDDPGIFDTTLEHELDWVLANTNWDPTDLENRLGNPRRFQLGKIRSI